MAKNGRRSRSRSQEKKSGSRRSRDRRDDKGRERDRDREDKHVSHRRSRSPRDRSPRRRERDRRYDEEERHGRNRDYRRDDRQKDDRGNRKKQERRKGSSEESKHRVVSDDEKSSDLHSSSTSKTPERYQGIDEMEVTEGYRLYQERRKQRKQEEEKKAAALIEGMEGGHKVRKVELKDFPNYKRKLVVQNLPLDLSEDDIMNYFFTILSSFSKEEYQKNPIMSVIRYKDLGFVTLEFRKREDGEVCLSLDGTDFKSGYKMRIMRVKRFIDDWNADIEKGKNPIDSMTKAKGSSLFTAGGILETETNEKKHKKDKNEEVDNRIYMGNIPTTMTDMEVRKMCESFGRLKSFNLVKDPMNPDVNKGYAFFEYVDERSIDKAIKALNGLDFKEKKLKVQRASTHQKPTQAQQQIGMYKNVPDEKRLPIPLFAMTPSRVVQFLNMISVEDLFDEDEIFQVKDDLLQECKNYGEIISLEIPKPDEKGNATYGVGKIFVKFNHIVAAKQARYKLSGRKYNGRTIVVSFYPEHYFDIKEFSII